MLAIIKKELRTYFSTMTGYGFLGFFVLITGYFFVSQNIVALSANYNEALAGSMIMFLILVPVITMRLFAEESRQRTDQLLYSSPITVNNVVFGKFIAAGFLYLLGVLITLAFPFLLSKSGQLDWGLTFVGILGYFMMGLCLISIGIFISVLTDNQIIAAVATFVAIFLLLMMDNITQALPISVSSSLIFVSIAIILIVIVVYSSTKNVSISAIFGLIGFVIEGMVYLIKPNAYDALIVKVLSWFSVLSRFENFYMGVLSISDVVYYITFAFVFLYFTAGVIEKRRWS